MSLADPELLLRVWEAASTAPPLARPAVLAAGLDVEGALDLPLAELTALAAGAWRDAFGDRVDGVAVCGACGERLDVSVPVDALSEVPAATSVHVDTPGGGVVVRSLTLRDLLGAAGAADPAEALWTATVRDDDDRPVAMSAVDATARAAIDEAAEVLAGSAGLTVACGCPHCASPVRAPLDLGALLWERIQARVPAVLGEVAELAMAFGWSQHDVLAMSPVRRAAYLELARGAAS